MTEDLESAVARYTGWEEPWRFYERVLATLASESDRAAFQAAWREALDEKHWTQADLTACAHHAEQSLLTRFPEFKPSTAAAIVRAAAYEWK